MVAALIMTAILVCMAAHAQTTNLQALYVTVPVSMIESNAPAKLPDSTGADIAKVFSDFGKTVSPQTISLVLLIGLPFVKALSGYLRKAIPKQLQVNKAGLLLAHVAGIDNPTLESLEAEIPKISMSVPAQPVAPATQPKE